MVTTVDKHERNLASIIHASTFSKYLFPFGNIIVPLILWVANKKTYEYVAEQGKRALNFQISLLVYSLFLVMLTIPFFIGVISEVIFWENFNFIAPMNFEDFSIHLDSQNFHIPSFIWPVGILVLGQVMLSIINIVYTILATIRSNEGQDFKYPLTINFIK
ncbi:DUF4870 domain-containing protein [Arenibacter sp. 6A1]|uniref:DUF4870 domain-containing protein n=1 Tax=Arenibacter sp. 6A1 TaxID=2720391 RepID=UPI001446EFEC|nr:DUF4870 domain-containing protein [Arenibacter sp. 6A1]NKI27176.1 DUF4870 domain-containing protein [Arenibacter sp. 6A1]